MTDKDGQQVVAREREHGGAGGDSNGILSLNGLNQHVLVLMGENQSVLRLAIATVFSGL